MGHGIDAGAGSVKDLYACGDIRMMKLKYVNTKILEWSSSIPLTLWYTQLVPKENNSVECVYTLVSLCLCLISIFEPDVFNN